MRRTGLYLVLLFFLCSCRAERFNPLDPKSPDFKDEATIYGSVADRYGAPVEGATVELEPGYYQGTSNSSGEYEISGAKTGVYTAVASKAGFSADTLSAEVIPGSPLRADFILNHLPTYRKLYITTHNDSTSAGNDFYAVCFTRICDSDGSVRGDSVFFAADTLLLWRMENMGGDSCDSFSVQLPDDSLPGNTLEYLVGKDLFVHATDDAGGCSVSEPFGISRIIYENPVAESPDGVAPQNPVTFMWFTVKASFEFTYTLTLQKILPLPVDSWVIEGIPSASNEYFLAEVLDAGRYLWSVKAVDSFGNTSRSQVLEFVVN